MEYLDHIQSQFHLCLQYFSDVGLILLFDSVHNLDQYVFHRPMFVVDILRSLFHHDLPRMLNYNDDQLLQDTFDRQEFNLLINRYQHEGLLDAKLLVVLWHKHGLRHEDTEALKQLIIAFRLCYPVSEQSNLLFLPWFVENKECPHDVA